MSRAFKLLILGHNDYVTIMIGNYTYFMLYIYHNIYIHHNIYIYIILPKHQKKNREIHSEILKADYSASQNMGVGSPKIGGFLTPQNGW